MRHKDPDKQHYLERLLEEWRKAGSTKVNRIVDSWHTEHFLAEEMQENFIEWLYVNIPSSMDIGACASKIPSRYMYIHLQCEGGYLGIQMPEQFATIMTQDRLIHNFLENDDVNSFEDSQWLVNEMLDGNVPPLYKDSRLKQENRLMWVFFAHEDYKNILEVENHERTRDLYIRFLALGIESRPLLLITFEGKSFKDKFVNLQRPTIGDAAMDGTFMPSPKEELRFGLTMPMNVESGASAGALFGLYKNPNDRIPEALQKSSHFLLKDITKSLLV